MPGTSIKYNVVSVPTFILFHGGSEVGRIEGADAPSLVRAIDDLGKKKKAVVAAAKPAAGASSAAGAPSAEAAAKAQKKLERRMQGIIDSAPVVLFMKGTPSGPQCGFSRKAIATLSAIQVEDGGSLVESKWFNSFNILDDNDVRQGLKAYSNWPTFPQLYVSGSLLGGLDIMNEMAEDGDLEDAILEACAAGAALFERLAGLVAQSPVMVFIKGTPEEPKCGFSRKMVALLNSTGIPYGSFDILEDPAVRQGLKTFSNWPTFPQLYAGGKLVGGNDIAHEMAEDDELVPVLQAALE